MEKSSQPTKTQEEVYSELYPSYSTEYITFVRTERNRGSYLNKEATHIKLFGQGIFPIKEYMSDGYVLLYKGNGFVQEVHPIKCAYVEEIIKE